jgi:2-polyprenyl-3-methyl-5-hydroxy-6-metoxy-1,4-benzoquinol methylase
MHACPVCARPADAPFLELDQVPVQVNVIHHTRDHAASIRRGDLRLVFCAACGLIWNTAFDAELVAYDDEYDNSLHHSPTFSAYASSLAARLVVRFALAGARVAEVGCGQGDFLRLLCAAGAEAGFGFDPSFTGASVDERVTVCAAAFDGAQVDAALLCCRHVLEHVDDPLAFATALRRSLRTGTPVYVEVPNGAFQLEHAVVWDLIYAHVATFTAPSLATLFEHGGFASVETGTSFGDQFLWLEARAGSSAPTDRRSDVERIGRLVDTFAASYRDTLTTWQAHVHGLRASGRTTALWGAGAKGVALLNALGPADGVAVAVDLNPRKQGTFVTGTGHPIVAPELLPGYAPDVVFVANPIYVDEVRARLTALGLRCEVATV